MTFRTRLSLAVIYVVWGANFMAIDVAVRNMSPAAMMGVRFTLAGALLIPIGRRLAPPSADQGVAWKESIRTSLPLFAGGSGLLAWGQVYVASSIAAVVIATIPLWLIGLDLAAGRLTATPRVLLAPVAGLAGVAVIANPNVAEPVNLAGLGILLAAAMCWAIGSRWSRATTSSNLVERTGMQMLAGGLMLVLAAVLLAALGHGPGQVTGEGLAALVWLIAIPSMIGFTAYNHALKHAPVSAVAMYPYINTVVAVVLGVTLLGEPLTASRFVGSVIIVVAATAMTVARGRIGLAQSPDAGRDSSTPR